jgi:hypothetical protein
MFSYDGTTGKVVRAQWESPDTMPFVQDIIVSYTAEGAIEAVTYEDDFLKHYQLVYDAMGRLVKIVNTDRFDVVTESAFSYACD